MKTDTGHKIRLGIFLSIGITAFILAIYFIGEGQHLFSSSFRVNAIFRHVAGLQAGNNIRLSGVNIGTVADVIMVSDTSVRVVMLIDESVRKFIRKDAVALIGSEGLMGNKALVLQPGTGGQAEIAEGDIVQTTQPADIAEIMESLKTTLDNTAAITTDLALITNTIQTGDGIVNLDQTMKSLKMAAERASTITEHLSVIMDSVQSGRGTVGKLLMDPILAGNVDSAIVHLKQGSEGFRNLVGRTDSIVARNLDSTVVNLRTASDELRTLIEKARRSWLLWGF